MALDFAAYERECRSMGGLFQQLAHEMKNSSSVWQDFISKAHKFHSSLGSMAQAMSAFLDSFQKIADLANNSKGAVRDIGGSLTKFCLRQRSVEEKLKEFNTILGGTFSPIPGLLDDWKKTVVHMDNSHGKEYKKLSSEIQKNLNDANKLKKQVEKGGRAEKLQPSLDSKIKAVEWKYSELATNESVSLKKLTLHERQRFCFFVKCLMPLLDKQNEILTEATHSDEVKKMLKEQTNDQDDVIKYCEDFVEIFRSPNADQQGETFKTPPGTPHLLTRHSSSLSIRSSNSALNQQRRSQPILHHHHQHMEQSDQQSIISGATSTGGPYENDSLASQDTLTRRQSTINNDNPSTTTNNSNKEYANGFLATKNGAAHTAAVVSQVNDYSTPVTLTATSSNNMMTFGGDRRSLTHSSDSLQRKRVSKQNSGRNLAASEVEDAELILAHRSDPNRPFTRATVMRNSIAAPSSKHYAAVQPLESPIRPGRKNDKRATLGYGGDFLAMEQQNSEMAQNAARYRLSGVSGFATLTRSSFRVSPAKANFYGGNFSAGMITQSIPTSPPPPPPPPSVYNFPVRSADETKPPKDTDEQIDMLLRAAVKKNNAPLPPPQRPASPPLPPPPLSITQHQSQVRSSFFNSPSQSLTQAPTKLASSPTGVSSPSHNLTKTATFSTRLTNVTIPYYKSAAGDKTGPSMKAGLGNSTPTAFSGSTSPGAVNDIPIRILRKYPEGLATTSPPATSDLAPPKPPPPLRNSSTTLEESSLSPDLQVPKQLAAQQPKQQLGRSPSIKQQGAPKDCPSIPKAAPLTINDIGGQTNENCNSNNNNCSNVSSYDNINNIGSNNIAVSPSNGSEKAVANCLPSSLAASRVCQSDC